MIPKIIHYCWFGGGKKPKLIKKSIDSWQNFMDDYELVLWNEQNTAFTSRYLKTAYVEKNWANLSNYVRLKSLYDWGGIYLDADVQALKTFDPLLDDACFFGAQKQKNPEMISTAVIGSEKKHWFIKKMLNQIESYFDGKEKPRESSSKLISELVKHEGYKKYDDQPVEINGLKIYPTRYFHPAQEGVKPTQEMMTHDTYCVHHYQKSWRKPKLEKILKLFGIKT